MSPVGLVAVSPAHGQIVTDQSADESDLGARVREAVSRREPPPWPPGAAAVLKALAEVPDNGGLIASELAAVLGQDARYVHAQIRRLRAAGAVVSSESIRVTNSHSSAKVWRLP
jgi:DNA-binding transcriptional ArsR family regulator